MLTQYSSNSEGLTQPLRHAHESTEHYTFKRETMIPMPQTEQLQGGTIIL